MNRRKEGEKRVELDTCGETVRPTDNSLAIDRRHYTGNVQDDSSNTKTHAKVAQAMRLTTRVYGPRVIGCQLKNRCRIARAPKAQQMVG